MDDITLRSQLEHSPQKLLRRLASYTANDGSSNGHSLHPYPAKFIPQVPREIIAAHTNERNTVFDPFCGSGTTLLEACISGRRSIGSDSNPVAALIARAKCTTLSEVEIARFWQFIEWVRTRAPPRTNSIRSAPDVRGIEHWFEPQVRAELSCLLDAITKIASEDLKCVMLCLFSSIIVSVSNQESETRYAAVDKGLAPGDVFRKFSQKALRALPSIISFSSQFYGRVHRPRVLRIDIRSLNKKHLADVSVDLIVTSPPYPNSFDYYLYHKCRMAWLGFDHEVVREQEIGSRHEHSSKKEPIATFEKKMSDAMRNIARVLKPSKLAYFLVGDSIIGGKCINMADIFQGLAERHGLRGVDSIDYSLSLISRSFREKSSENCHGGAKNRAKKQHILVFEALGKRPAVGTRSRILASPVATWRQVELNEHIPNGARIAIRSSDQDRHIHSLGLYPSKFIPDLPRWAIGQYSRPGDIVFDPFVGSGTTNVEALALGRNAIGCDISAYACLLTRAKTTNVSSNKLRREADHLVDLAANVRRLPTAKPMRFDLDDFWFPLSHLAEIAQLQKAVMNEASAQTRDFFLAVLSTVIRKCTSKTRGS